MRHHAILAAVCAALAVTTGATAAPGGSILFVDDSTADGGQGESWATAVRLLQDALDIARASGEVVEIRVAQGTYAPDEGEGYFEGDRRATFDLISGIAMTGGWAGFGAADPDERDPARFPTVLTGDLDRDDRPGFVGDDENSYHVVTVGDSNEETVLDGFVVRGGHANGDAPDDRGAGILVDGGLGSIRSVVVEGNRAFVGGGMLLRGTQVALDDVVLAGNHADFGGGMYADGADGAMTRLEVRSNTALSGAGAYLLRSEPVVSGALFDRNSAGFEGGGLYAAASDLIVDATTFQFNAAAFAGGGAFLTSSAPIFRGCTFLTNFADDGAGVRAVGGAVELDGCDFVVNFAINGSGMYSTGGAPRLSGCFFDANEAERGAGLYHDGAGTATVGDGLFSENDADEGGAIFVGGGHVVVDGATVVANRAGRFGGGFATDEGTIAIRSSIFDRNESSGTFVSGGGAVYLRTGSSTVDDCVFVDNTSKFGGAIQLEESDAVFTSCLVLDCAAIIGGGAHVTAGAPVFDACNFGGNVADGDVIAFGGGVYAAESAVHLIGCRIEANAAGASGGGLYFDAGAPRVTDCTVRSNVAVVDGGGLFTSGAAALIETSTFVANQADGSGGGLATSGDGTVVRGCAIIGNGSTLGGGAINLGGAPTIADSIFTGNVSRGLFNCVIGGFGGGLGSLLGAPAVVNCTFAFNRAECGGRGGGVAVTGGVVVNAILWGNADGGGEDESAQIFGTPASIDYSCVQGLTGDLGGTGNIGLDPRFVDADGLDGVHGTGDDDLRLRGLSPCVDAGDNGAVAKTSTTDVLGNPRRTDDPDVEDTGAGQAPVVDLGAVERLPSACRGDLDGDADVDVADILVLLVAWGPCSGCPEDLDESGVVDFGDVLALLRSWGACP